MKKISIAKAAGIAHTHLSMILHGKRRPSPDVASRLEAVTGKHRLYWLYPGEYDEAGNRVGVPPADPASEARP